MEQITKPLILGFDPDHPDAEILEAFEKVRNAKAAAYRQEDANAGDWPAGEVERIDAFIEKHEAGVTQNWATTPAGVAARLALVVPSILQERWVDRGIMEQGIAAYFSARDGLESDADRQLAKAMFELMTMEFEIAFDAYERAKANHLAALELRSTIADEHPREHNRAIVAKAEAYTDRLGNQAVAALSRLVRALAPDLDCYQRKVEVCIAEGFGQQAGVWLMRDVNALMGRIDPPAEGK